MATNELEAAVKLIEFILNIFGINLFGVFFEESIWKRCVRKLPSIIILTIPICAVVAFFYNIHDYIKTIESIYTISVCFQIALKYCILRRIVDGVVKFIEKCRIFRSNQALDIERASALLNVNKVIARPTLTIQMFISFFCTSVILLSLAPLLRSERSLPVPLYLIVRSPFETPFYEINYGFIIAGSFFGFLLISGIETILISFVSEVCLQANVIKYKLATLGEDEEDDQRSKIREICQLHWELTSAIKDLNNIFSNLLLVQISTSFLTISTALFMVATRTSNYSFLVCAVFVTIQLGLYCLYGEIVKDKLEKLLFTLYNNQWYNLNSSEKKSLNIMMSFAQAVPTLKAVGYVELSMETYFQILKAVYSYLAIMQNIQPED